jgi:hypothetical protein
MLPSLTVPFRHRLARAAALAGLALAAATAATPAGAAPVTGFLNWGSTPLHTGPLSKCYAAAAALLAKDGFSNTAQRASEVVGNYQGTYATITCIRTIPKATAVVMVIGMSEGKTAQVRDMLIGQLAGPAPSR